MVKNRLLSVCLVCTTICLLLTGFFLQSFQAVSEPLEIAQSTVQIGNETVNLVQSSPKPTDSSQSSAPVSSEPPDLTKIRKQKKLVVAMLSTDNPPFFMTDSKGKLYGLDVQIAQEIANELGVAVEFDRDSETFNDTVDMVVTGKADIAISKLSRTLKRAKRVIFSRPYVKMRHGMLINRLQLAQEAKTSKYKNVSDMVRHLEGKVGVIKDSSYVGYTMQKFSKAKAVELPLWNPDVIRAVTDGQVLSAYRDELEVKRIVLSSPDAALKLQTIAFTDTLDPISIAVPWNSTHLLSFVNQVLETYQFDFTVDQLIKAYPEVFKDKGI